MHEYLSLGLSHRQHCSSVVGSVGKQDYTTYYNYLVVEQNLNLRVQTAYNFYCSGTHHLTPKSNDLAHKEVSNEIQPTDDTPYTATAILVMHCYSMAV